MVAIFNSLKNKFLLCFDTLVSSSGSCIFLTYFKLLEITFISYKTNEFLLLLIQIVCLYNLFICKFEGTLPQGKKSTSKRPAPVSFIENMNLKNLHSCPSIFFEIFRFFKIIC